MSDKPITSAILTLLISNQFARIDKRSQAGAIKKTARRIRDKTKCARVYELCQALSKCCDDRRAEEAVTRAHCQLIAEGAL